MDASTQHSATGWFLGGLGCGALLGLIGTAAITIGAATSGPHPAYIPEDVNTACYLDGYQSKGKSKNTWSALGGGLVGTLVFVAIYVAATND